MQDNQGKITGTSIIDRDNQASFSDDNLIIASTIPPGAYWQGQGQLTKNIF